ncbi:MAG TPA: type II CAAX endopeptidase family protein [Pyrinomonadaceae bacterium]|nr:type II CAAX endopeptidase family protein [Pyrinomonadaceae bacterium]
MKPAEIFFNDVGRLRSGWRLLIFIIAYFLLLTLIGGALRFAHYLAPTLISRALLGSYLINVLSRLILLMAAVLVGWGCGRLLEGLPLRALGWARHRGWLRDLLVGTLVGIASLSVATAVIYASGGYQFTFNAQSLLPAVIRSLLLSALLFIVAAAAEEALFRGYPMQTLTRAKLAWVAVVLTSVPFALVHLNNPNVVPGFTFINTALAGVWLALAYLRTRSLWFPLGIHWSWNWTMGSVFGIPVSGIHLAANPLLNAVDAGPPWLTGGRYGIEGGAACTLALVLSTIFIWRTRLVSATEEMRRLTDEENPRRDRRQPSMMDHPHPLSVDQSAGPDAPSGESPGENHTGSGN